MQGSSENLTPDENEESGFFYGYIIIVASFLIYLMAWGLHISFGVFFKSLLVEFGWTRAVTSAAYTLGQALAGITGIFSGKLTDKFGPRLVLTVGGICLGLGSILLSRIETVWQFYFLYSIVGVGLGTTVSPLMSTTSRWFVRKRGLMTGVVRAGAGVGGVVLPLLAGWFILDYGWRNAYIYLGFITLVATILAAQILRRDPSQKGLSPYGEANTNGVGLQEEGFSLGKAVYFRQFWFLWVVFFCFGLIRSAIYIHIAPYTTDLGFSLIVSASVVATISGASSAGGLILGRVGDNLGNRVTVMMSFILIAITLFWVVFSRQIWMLYLFAVLFGLGWGAIATLRISVTGELFGLRSLGVILGIVEFGSKIGGAVGPFISGWIFDITENYFTAFLFVAGIAIVGLLSSWQLTSISRKAVVVNTDE